MQKDSLNKYCSEHDYKTLSLSWDHLIELNEASQIENTFVLPNDYCKVVELHSDDINIEFESPLYTKIIESLNNLHKYYPKVNQLKMHVNQFSYELLEAIIFDSKDEAGLNLINRVNNLVFTNFEKNHGSKYGLTYNQKNAYFIMTNDEGVRYYFKANRLVVKQKDNKSNIHNNWLHIILDKSIGWFELDGLTILDKEKVEAEYHRIKSTVSFYNTLNENPGFDILDSSHFFCSRNYKGVCNMISDYRQIIRIEIEERDIFEYPFLFKSLIKYDTKKNEVTPNHPGILVSLTFKDLTLYWPHYTSVFVDANRNELERHMEFILDSIHKLNIYEIWVKDYIYSSCIIDHLLQFWKTHNNLRSLKLGLGETKDVKRFFEALANNYSIKILRLENKQQIQNLYKEEYIAMAKEFQTKRIAIEIFLNINSDKFGLYRCKRRKLYYPDEI